MYTRENYLDVICDSDMLATLTYQRNCAHFITHYDLFYHNLPCMMSCGTEGSYGTIPILITIGRVTYV